MQLRVMRNIYIALTLHSTLVPCYTYLTPEHTLHSCHITRVPYTRNPTGIELNLWLVLYSRLRSVLSGTSRQTKFYRSNLWKVRAPRV